MIAPPEAAAEPRTHRDDIQTPVLDLVVVDDNVDAAETLQMYLETLGHRVRVFHRAHEALDCDRGRATRTCRFLMSACPTFPGMRLHGKFGRGWVDEAACSQHSSGYGQAKDHEASRAAGLDFHLVKPLDHSRLLEVLAQVGFAPAAQADAPAPDSPAPRAAPPTQSPRSRNPPGCAARSPARGSRTSPRPPRSLRRRVPSGARPSLPGKRAWLRKTGRIAPRRPTSRATARTPR
jgi:CheY-like chemotaxis protein